MARADRKLADVDICQARCGHSSFMAMVPHGSAVGLNSGGVDCPAPEEDRARQMSSSAGLGRWVSQPIIWLIYLYRMTLSPLMVTFFGGGCRYEPSCSHYAEGALRKYGAWRGSIMSVKRVLRCHPWHDGGYDPVP